MIPAGGSPEGAPDLSPLFHARSIAVVGGSPDPRKLGSWPLLALERRAYTGDVIVVNPRHREVLGHRCVADVDDVDVDVDAAMIMLPAEAAVDAAERCGRHGIRHLVIGASGFGETAEGSCLQQRLSAIAEEH